MCLETPVRSIRFLLVADVLADLIQTVDGASATFPAHPESPTNYDSPEGARVSRTPTMVEAQSGDLPIQDQLRDYFARLNGTAVMGQERGVAVQAGSERQIIELSNQAVDLSLAASAEAAELRRLAERYPPGKTKDLNPTSRWLLEVMVREHAAELNSQLDRSHASLMPVLTAIEI